MLILFNYSSIHFGGTRGEKPENNVKQEVLT